MSEFGKLRIPNTSSGAISAGVIIHELDLVNKLLARAGKAEAALESAQKMCDHWEAKAAERQQQVNEWKRRAGNAEFEVNRQRDLMNPVDWERVRIEAAIAAMQGMWASQRYNFGKPVPVLAVECADDLIAELQKKEVQG
jgi:multidrug resistance efflux pump